MKKAIELIRVSTEAQSAEDRASIPAQKTINRRTAANHGLEIVRTIEISDVSGANVLRSPEMQDLLRLIQQPEIVGVVCREFSRLMRPDNYDDLGLLQRFLDSKTDIYLPEGRVDPSDLLMTMVRAGMAGKERKELLERSWSAKEEKRRRGELAQSRIVLPWGIGYEQGKFFYKPETALVREAFNRFLAGNHNYGQLAKLVGVTPRGMHLIMRNPIWIGWRVIDKKRDSSGAGRYAGSNGRQADRRKIARAADEVIRVQVIAEPLVSDAEFQTVQRIMDLKQKRHWRSRTDYEHRFTYNGFLTCSACGEIIHTALARRDYYACRARRGANHSCATRYMGREKLEETLDQLFACSLTDRGFLAACVEEATARHRQDGKVVLMQRVSAQITTLRERRSRVIDAFLEGIIDRDDRDNRLASIDREIQTNQALLMREKAPAFDQATLAEAFAPLVEWEYWTREQKRLVLASIVPEIQVADYQVHALGLNPALFSNENTPVDMDSSRRPA